MSDPVAYVLVGIGAVVVAFVFVMALALCQAAARGDRSGEGR